MVSKPVIGICLIFQMMLFSIISFFLFRAVSMRIPVSKAHFDIDSRTYQKFAHNFYENNSLVDPDNKDSLSCVSVGYPIFVGIIYKIFGENINYVIWIQVLLSLLCIFLIFLLTKRLFGLTSAIVAAELSSLNLGFLVYSQFLLTELLLTTFLLAFLDRFIAFYFDHKNSSLIASSLFLGYSIVIKPAAILYIPAIIFFILYFFPKDFSYRFKTSFLFLLFFMIPIVPFMIHNKTVYNSFSLCSAPSTNIYHYFLPKLVAQTKNISEEAARKLVKSDPNYKATLLEYLATEPGLVIQVWMKNVIKTFLGLHTTALKVLVEPKLVGGECSFFKVSGLTLKDKISNYITYGTKIQLVHSAGYFEMFFNFVRYIFVILALFYLAISRRWFLFFLFLSYIFYFAMISGHDGCGRFRMMFEPVLTILFAYGIVCSFDKLVYKEQHNS